MLLQLYFRYFKRFLKTEEGRKPPLFSGAQRIKLPISFRLPHDDRRKRHARAALSFTQINKNAVAQNAAVIKRGMPASRFGKIIQFGRNFLLFGPLPGRNGNVVFNIFQYTKAINAAITASIIIISITMFLKINKLSQPQISQLSADQKLFLFSPVHFSKSSTSTRADQNEYRTTRHQ